MDINRDKRYKVRAGKDFYLVKSESGFELSKHKRGGTLFYLKEAESIVKDNHDSGGGTELRIVPAQRRHVISITRPGGKFYVGDLRSDSVAIGDLEMAVICKNPISSDGFRKDAAVCVAIENNENYDDALSSLRKEKVYV